MAASRGRNFPASLVLQLDPALRFKPATRVENACATGSAAIYQGLSAIAARRARTVLVVGVEKMTEIAGPAVGDILIRAAYVREEGEIEGGFAGVFGRIAQAYFQRWGDKSDALARIAAKNHRNGSVNPLAQLRKDLGYEFCRTVSDKNPLVAGPLRRTDCSLVSDGAAALVLTDVETALACGKAVVFRAAAQVSDFLPMSKRDIVAYEGPALAWRRALAAARIGLDDLSCAEVHDCFTIAELMTYEAMGLDPAGPGRARDRGGLDREGRAPAGQCVGRAQGEGPSDRRHRRLDARAAGDAAHRHGGTDPGEGCDPRRSLQHGWRSGGELRQRPRADR